MLRETEPSKEQAAIIRKHHLNPEHWVVIFENRSEIEIVSRRSRQRRVLTKNDK